MYYNPNDDKPYIFFVKVPQVEQKFAMGFKSLSSANIAYIIDLAKDVGSRTFYEYTEEPAIYCSEMSKIIVDNTSLSFCISRGYSFEVFNGIRDIVPTPKQKESKVTVALGAPNRSAD